MIKRGRTCLCMGIGVCLIICICLSMVGCGGSRLSDDMSPTETVSVFLDAFKAQDEDTMNQIYAGEGNDFMSAYESREGEDALTQTMQDKLMEKWYDFDYEVTGEKISEDGKTASVDLTITTYNMKTVFNNFYQEFMGQALEQYSGKSGKVTEKDYDQLAVQILQEQIDAATDKDYTGSASLSLTRAAGRWQVDQIGEENSDFLNAVSGGLMDVLQDVVDTRGNGEKTNDENEE